MATGCLAARRRRRLVLILRRAGPRRCGLGWLAHRRLAVRRRRCRLARGSLARRSLARDRLTGFAGSRRLGGSWRALAGFGDCRRLGPSRRLFRAGGLFRGRLRCSLGRRFPCRRGWAAGRFARRLGRACRCSFRDSFLRRRFHGWFGRARRCRLLRRLATLGCRCSRRLGPRRAATRSTGFCFRLHFVRAQTTIVLRHILSPCIGRGGRVL